MFWGNLSFIVKIVFDFEIKSKVGKEFINEKKKKFGIGFIGFGFGNVLGKLFRVCVKFYILLL